MFNKLLMDTYPLIIIPELAELIGLNEAIILQQVHYWIQNNERNNKTQKNGYTWTYNSIPKWQEQFPFWSQATVKRIFTSLEKSGLLITQVFNRAKFDRTKWYRINYKLLDDMVANTSEHRMDQFDLIQSNNLTRPIPEITQRGKICLTDQQEDDLAAKQEAQQQFWQDIEFTLQKQIEQDKTVTWIPRYETV